MRGMTTSVTTRSSVPGRAARDLQPCHAVLRDQHGAAGLRQRLARAARATPARPRPPARCRRSRRRPRARRWPPAPGRRHGRLRDARQADPRGGAGVRARSRARRRRRSAGRCRRPSRARGPCPLPGSLVVKNGSKARRMTSAFMPTPVSLTLRQTSGPAGSSAGAVAPRAVPSAPTARGAQGEPAAARHRVPRVDDQVDDHLLDLAAVHAHEQLLRGVVHGQLDVLADEPAQHAGRLVHDLRRSSTSGVSTCRRL